MGLDVVALAFAVVLAAALFRGQPRHDRQLTPNGKTLRPIPFNARRGACASFGGALRRPLRACARHHSSCLTLRLRFNLPQPGVSIIRAAPQSQPMEIGAAVAITAFFVGFCAGYFVRTLVSWRRPCGPSGAGGVVDAAGKHRASRWTALGSQCAGVRAGPQTCGVGSGSILEDSLVLVDSMWTRGGGVGAKYWRPRSELNRATRSCEPHPKGRTHGCTDQCCKREESSCQLGDVHTWHIATKSQCDPSINSVSGFGAVADIRPSVEAIAVVHSPAAFRRALLPSCGRFELMCRTRDPACPEDRGVINLT